MRFTKLVAYDLLFLILIINSVVFIILNIGDYSWLGNIEMRAFVFIGLNYYIFRSLLNPDWSDDIAEFIINIMKFSIYLAVIEFFVINTGEIANVIEDRYLAVFKGSERLYEYILFAAKPIGIYPGTHNLGVAAVISILYLVTTKSIHKNKGYFIASMVVFFVGFSLTVTLALLIVYSISMVASQGMTRRLVKRSLYASVLAATAGLIFKFGGVLSQLKSTGEISASYVESESNVYITSISNSFDSLLQFPFGTPLNQIDLYENEVYISRLIIYFGWPIILFLGLAFVTLVAKFRLQSDSGVFFTLSYLTLFISSFHYGSINYYPLTILVPLTFVFIHYSKNQPRTRPSFSNRNR
tara:strand:- start:207 stop:1271 length:1065 start_codon:yes stop_codon:yes gene_type:complete